MEIDPYRWRAISVSFNALGVLSHLMCMACDPDMYGIVQSEKIPMDTKELLYNLKGNQEDIAKGVEELISKNLLIYGDEKTPYMIPFMVRDYETRRKRREAGLKGGNPALLREKNTSRKVKPKEAEGEYYLTHKKRKLSGPQLQAFEAFWKTFNYSQGKAAAADAWIDLRVNNEMFQRILKGALKESQRRPQLLDSGRTPIMAQGWLSQRRFEDKI